MLFKQRLHQLLYQSHDHMIIFDILWGNKPLTVGNADGFGSTDNFSMALFSSDIRACTSVARLESNEFSP